MVCKIRYITFRPNTFRYGQDFAYRRGVPAGVRFEVVDWWSDGYWLRASGYGGKPYGNGRIFFPFRQHVEYAHTSAS